MLNIAFNESRKKQHLIVETYEGSIPHLKSRQYSGPIRNTNINKISIPDNLSSLDFEVIKRYLNSPENIQISKHQYLLNPSMLPELAVVASLGCLFYKEHKKPMYQVDSVKICDKLPIGAISLQGVAIYGETNEIKLSIDSHHKEGIPVRQLAEAYVDLKKTNHELRLVFDYGSCSIPYDSINKTHFDRNTVIRNYAFESSVLLILRKNHWKHFADSIFIHTGNSFQRNLLSLIENGIKVYTKEKKPVVKANYSDLHISYDMDWFQMEGRITINQEEISIGKFLSLIKQNSQWIELCDGIIPVPKVFNTVANIVKIHHDLALIPKTEFITVATIVHDLSLNAIDGISKIVDYENIDLIIDKKFLSILKHYQITGTKWLLALHESKFGGCLADDMGLGKTIQTIAYLSDLRMDNSTSLIVAPKTLLSNWEREFMRFSPTTNVLIYHGVNRFIPKNFPKIILTTYGTLLNDIEILKKHTFTNLIVDEAQFIKNPNAKKHRAIKLIKAETRIILTGTPIENNIKEYWGLMKFINPQFFRSIDPLKKSTNCFKEIETVRKLTSPFLLRRTKQDILVDFPEKNIQTIYCEMEGSQSELYNMMLKSIQYELASKGSRFEVKTGDIVLKGLLCLQEICCHPQLLDRELNPLNCNKSIKFDLLLELLDRLQGAGHKIVVFSRFTRMLKIIEAQLREKNSTYFYLDGKTDNRIDIVDKFEGSEEGVFLISLTAGGTGLNLTSADTVIIYDPWWNPAVEEQAQDRVYRIGQTKNVTVYKLIVSDTIEEKVQLLQKKKIELSDQLLDGHEIPTHLTINEMRKLIEG